MAEIITLQFGHYPNYVGTHWWNIQESSFIYSGSETGNTSTVEINHDVLFREGLNLVQEVTYTPRLISFDLKGSLNTLREEGQLYNTGEHEDDGLQWESDVTLHKIDQAKKNKFLSDLEEDDTVLSACSKSDTGAEDTQEKDIVSCNRDAAREDVTRELISQPNQSYNLDDHISVWSDFLKPHLHPKSICLVDQYQHMNEIDPFDVFGYGVEVYGGYNWHAKLEDRLHFFTEECDNMQGFHILADTCDAFGGLCSAALEELAEEFGTKGLLVCSTEPPVPENLSMRQNHHRLLNSLLTYEKVLSHTSALIPLSLIGESWKTSDHPRPFPHINYKANLSYHTSAILAASLDNMTMPYRVCNSPTLMTHLTQALTPLSRKMLCLQSSIPFPLSVGSTLADTLDKFENVAPWQALTPYCNANDVPIAQSAVLRGVCGTQLNKSLQPDVSHDTVQDMIQNYLWKTTSTSSNAICHIKQPLKTSTPFPDIFNDIVSSDGFIVDDKRDKSSHVGSIPVFTSLQATNSAGNIIDALLSATSKLKIKKYHKFIESGIEEDEYLEARHNLETKRDSYMPNSDNMP